MPTAFDPGESDHAMLRILATGGRITATGLARRVGLSKGPVQARRKRPEAAAVIPGQRAVPDPVRMGQAHMAFVELRPAGIPA